MSAATAAFVRAASSQVPALGTAATMVVAAAGVVAFAPDPARAAGVICQDFNGQDGGAAFAQTSSGGTACGRSANSNGTLSVAMGNGAGAFGDNSVALGVNAGAGGLVFDTNAGGLTTDYNNANTTAIGTGAEAGAGGANQANATALGTAAQANAVNATALGSSAQANGGNATAIGNGATANAVNAIALGDAATANYDNSIAIGVGATTTRDNQVMLGNGLNTYTLTGVASQASKAAQAGPTYLMTTDSTGNLAASTFDVATLANLPAQVAQNSSDISTLNSTVSSHTSELADHETRIANNTNAIALHTTEIADLDTRVTTNTTNITQLDGRIGALEAGFQDLGDQISENRTEARAGTALALATAGLRYDDRPEKLSLAGGFGHFKGQSGLALGLGYNTSEDFRLNAALSATTNHGDVGVSVGASWTLN
ncbi:YadA-like family protein [Mesorhizobium opportunistum]|uniref:YadA-like family protein n=1 Tax=Mesorhizobium opportunistum TaxID=593909 RepID=A0ABV1YIF2_9HYPH|nr:YadA-like family protein [Mesorhizobium sp.]